MGCSGVLWDVPGEFRGCSGLFRAVPGVFRGCSGVFRGCSGVFRACSGFYRHPFNAVKEQSEIDSLLPEQETSLREFFLGRNTFVNWPTDL